MFFLHSLCFHLSLTSRKRRGITKNALQARGRRTNEWQEKGIAAMATRRWLHSFAAKWSQEKCSIYIDRSIAVIVCTTIRLPIGCHPCFLHSTGWQLHLLLKYWFAWLAEVLKTNIRSKVDWRNKLSGHLCERQWISDEWRVETGRHFETPQRALNK